jgi:hypothetical protein
MKTILDKLFESADNHGEDSEPDHTVGDLQDLLTTTWAILTPDQKRTLLQSDAVETLLDMGARDEFTVDDLLEQLDEELKGNTTRSPA